MIQEHQIDNLYPRTAYAIEPIVMALQNEDVLFTRLSNILKIPSLYVFFISVRTCKIRLNYLQFNYLNVERGKALSQWLLPSRT